MSYHLFADHFCTPLHFSLPIPPSVRPSIPPSLCLSVSSSLCRPVHPSIRPPPPPVPPSLRLSVSLSLLLSVAPSIRPSAPRPSISPTLRLYVSLSLLPSVLPSFRPSVPHHQSPGHQLVIVINTDFSETMNLANLLKAADVTEEISDIKLSPYTDSRHTHATQSMNLGFISLNAKSINASNCT